MADFTDQDKEMLDKLRKQFDRTGKTTSLRDPWQERMGHDTSAPSRSVLAAKILEGFSGSWASQYNYGYGSATAPDVEPPSTAEEFIAPDDQGAPVPIRAKTSKIGLRGPPEINFQPFDCYTNKFGNKGPSLVGHPISFEIVGPTLKSDFCDWTWIVQEGAGLEGGDRLFMSSRPDGTPAVSSQVNQAYNVTPFSGVGTVGESNGGLYVVIADDGANPGSIYQPGAEVPMGALPDYLDTAKYEIFRINQISEGFLDLHPSKRLSSYFDLPVGSVDRRIRAITMVRPYVTRLQAHPGTGAGLGREQTFSVLIPEFSASSDLYPPYGGGVGAWLTGGFTSLTAPNDPGETGSTYPGVYGGKMRLPIPQPVKDGWAFVQRQTAFFPGSDVIGEWRLKSTPTGNAQFLGLRDDQILRISHTKRSQGLELGLGSVPSCIGWFPITSLPPTEPPSINLARNAEVDPQSGLIFWGPGPLVVAAFITPEVEVDFTVHDPVSLIWGDGVLPTLPFNIDKVEAATLTNLIDPNWVGRFEKQVSQAFPSPLTGAYPLSPPAGSGGGRPNRAIFNTANFKKNVEDPGSLMDLGFRMVFFPAKDDDAGVAVPDFNNPIYSHEVVIDGSIDEKQYIEVDYSAGLVRLSHPPPTQRSGIPDEPSEIIPNGLPGETTNNQRREVILFAACVPYSMEDSQAGTGNRITASAGEGAPDEDVYSKQVEAKLELSEMTFVGTPPFIGPSTYGTVDIVLDRLWNGPATGVVTITTGGDTSRPLGRWGYTETRVETAGTLPNTYPVTVLSGISSFPAAADPDPGATGQTRGVILRREVFFGQESANLGSITDFYPTDKVYGSSVRAETLRFQRAKLKPQLDGSVSVQPMPDLGAVLDRPLSTLVPSKYTRPYNLIDNTGPFTGLSSYFSETGLWQGMVYQGEPNDPRGLNPGGEPLLLDSVSSPTLAFRPFTNGVPTSWLGAMAPYFGALSDGMVRMGDNWRWVAKVSLDLRNPLPDLETKVFLGFVQDESGGNLQATVGGINTGVTDLSTLLPSFTGVGFYVEGPTQTGWNFWNRGFGGPDNFVDTQVTLTGGFGFVEGPWYLVIESNRLNVGNTTSAQIKFGIYDADKNLLSHNTVTNAAQLPVSFSGVGLNFGFGIRKETGIGPGDFLYIHHMALSANIDQDDLPPLP